MPSGDLAQIIPPPHTHVLPHPRGAHKYTLSLRQRELQGALQLALAALTALQAGPAQLPLNTSTCTPILIFPLSISLAPRPCPPLYCRYAASDVFAASKSSLISISIFSSSKVHVIIDLSNAPAVTPHLLFVRALKGTTTHSLALFSLAYPHLTLHHYHLD